MKKWDFALLAAELVIAADTALLLMAFEDMLRMPALLERWIVLPFYAPAVTALFLTAAFCRQVYLVFSQKTRRQAAWLFTALLTLALLTVWAVLWAALRTM